MSAKLFLKLRDYHRRRGRTESRFLIRCSLDCGIVICLPLGRREKADRRGEVIVRISVKSGMELKQLGECGVDSVLRR